jgi:hypothetical protein
MDRRFRGYQAWRLHIGVLLTEAGLADHSALIDALLAPDFFAHQQASGHSLDELAGELPLLARRVLA